jgi:hypothetical protein
MSSEASWTIGVYDVQVARDALQSHHVTWRVRRVLPVQVGPRRLVCSALGSYIVRCLRPSGRPGKKASTEGLDRKSLDRHSLRQA